MIVEKMKISEEYHLQHILPLSPFSFTEACNVSRKSEVSVSVGLYYCEPDLRTRSTVAVSI